MSILDNIEKVDSKTLTQTEILKDNPSTLILIVTYEDSGQEIFYMTEEGARLAVNNITEVLLTNEFPGVVVLNDTPPKEQKDLVHEDLCQFNGILVIDETIRAVRIIDPAELPPA